MNKRIISLTLSVLLAATLLTGCADTAQTSAAQTEDTTINDTATAAASASATDESMFTTRDKEIGYSLSESTVITLSDNASSVSGSGASVSGNTVTISEEGTYVLTGTLSDGQIVVDAEDSAKLQIVLNGVSITNDSSAAIYIKQADKVFITTASETENTLATSGEFAAIDDNNIDAVIFSKTDLTLNGAGSLVVNAAYGHGIVSKDDLAVTSGSYEITAAEQGISGKNSVRIADGEISIVSGTDGIHSEDEDDATHGFVYIEDGDITISAEDDGVHADNYLKICGGTIDVTNSYEGLEGLSIDISGGDIAVVSSDDGLNASDGSGQTEMGAQDMRMTQGQRPTGTDQATSATQSTGTAQTTSATQSTDTAQTTSATQSTDTAQSTSAAQSTDTAQSTSAAPQMDSTASSACSITISGGTLTVNAGGDGIDSNGTLTISGGTTIVYGPTDNANAALDFNGAAVITGGTLMASGSSGMLESFDSSSTQCSIVYALSGSQKAGTAVALSDSDGNVILSFTPEKAFTALSLTAPSLKQGETYTLTVGTESYTIELSASTYSNGGGMGGNMGGQGGMGGNMGGGPGGGNMGGMRGGPGSASQSADTAAQDTAGSVTAA